VGLCDPQLSLKVDGLGLLSYGEATHALRDLIRVSPVFPKLNLSYEDDPYSDLGDADPYG
jgi:hypothetical protein